VGGPVGAWITPSPLARDQVRQLLGARLGSGAAVSLQIWCWDDLWRVIGEGTPAGPARLSEAAARAVLVEATARARREGALDELADLLAWPGFRRRLRGRIAAWTREERPAAAALRSTDPIQVAYWKVFGHYRAILNTLDAEDDSGYAVWASRTLVETPPDRIRKTRSFRFIDLEDDAPAVWRMLEHVDAWAESVEVTLAYEPADELREVYQPHALIRQQLLQWGFTEVRREWPLERPAGLAGVERALFEEDVHPSPPLESAEGMTAIGAPQGDGVGLVIAREVQQRLEAGAHPEDILVLFRRWDDDAALVLETLRLWDLPAAAEVPRLLSSDPAIASLRLAMNLPLEDWETSHLVQLLRHGQVRPDWPETRAPLALASAASAVHASRVFRGREALRSALDRAADQDPTTDNEPRRERGRHARDVVERMFGLLDPLNAPGRWSTLVARLRTLAANLGLRTEADPALASLWGALDDHGWVLDDLGRAQQPWSWADFTQEVEALVGDLPIDGQHVGGATVRLAALDDVAGARAAHVILGNLAEGTFPVREAVEADLEWNPAADDQAAGGRAQSPAFAREMLRFLRAVGSADESLVLVYPTSDVRGQELLKAGFLDDLLRLFTPEAGAQFHTRVPRLDPALVGQADLACAPHDLRVRAVALACTADDSAALTTLSSCPRHRRILDGTAAALRVLHHRNRNQGFDQYDGRLSDPRIMERIAARYGADYHFSPSQLESYIFCPFQFYLRYVLKLEPVDDRDELEEDFTERGSRIHLLLELLEQHKLQQASGASRLEIAREVIESELRTEPSDGSAMAAGLDEIDRRRLIRAIERYVRQHEAYERSDPAIRPQPHRFEVVFGYADSNPESYPGLPLGTGSETVLLQGKIDRLDLLTASTEPRFRVIDYKTGARPATKDVKQALYLQLPLYALAVERLVLARQQRLYDVGYWSLARDGFKPIRFLEWDEDQDRLEGYLVALVNHLRHGIFAVDSRKDDCTSRCEFASVCRIGPIRGLNKRRDDGLRLELKVR
jgi:hypothetical protein